jgi:multidrug efflux system membrane fusion protein
MKKATRMWTVIRQPGSPRMSLQGLLILFALLVITGCGENGSDAQMPQNQPPDVKIAQPLAQDVTEWDEYTGRIEAISSVDVRARVSGSLEKVNFKAGER